MPQSDKDLFSALINSCVDCFQIAIYKSKKHTLGEGVIYRFFISSTNINLLTLFAKALGNCGKLLIKGSSATL